MTPIEKIAEQKRQVTTEKVQKALDRLKNGNQEFTLKDVAELAQISYKTFYNRKDLMELVKEAQEVIQAKLNPVKPTPLKEMRFERFREENRRLKEDMKMLLEENMRLTTNQTKLENRIADLEEYIQKLREGKVAEIGAKRTK